MIVRKSSGPLRSFRAAMHLWSGRVHRHYGIVHADEKEFANAVESYKRALRLNPNLAIAFLELGIIEWRELGRATHALQNLTRALELSPDWPVALFNRGQAHQRAGDYENALGDLQRYVKTGDNVWHDDALRLIALIENMLAGDSMIGESEV